MLFKRKMTLIFKVNLRPHYLGRYQISEVIITKDMHRSQLLRYYKVNLFFYLIVACMLNYELIRNQAA